jgi:hypothetical protein
MDWLLVIVLGLAMLGVMVLWKFTRPCRACGRRWKVFERTGGMKLKERRWWWYALYEFRCKYCGETKWRMTFDEESE